MTKGQIIKDLKNIIGPGNSIDDTGLLMWINEAYMSMIDEITKVNPDYFTKIATTSSAIGQAEYALPTDFERILKVEVNLNGQWYRAFPLANINQLYETSSGNNYGNSNLNLQYYIIGQNIGFTPVPAETTADNIKIWYVYTPSELANDSDTPAFPAKYHSMLKFGAYANFLDQDDEHASAENMRRRFDQYMMKMIESMQDNQVDVSKAVQVTTNQALYFDEDYV